ncbi:MAG: SPFH domain-containing protein [Campylobacterota bacterium]|nr:SPFH domain-containing protein [Campylobacterota bacterium]
MLGIKYIKVPPTNYLIKYNNGHIAKEGVGLSFFYYAPTTTIVSIPIGSVDAPFIFEEVTSDFQSISIQGQITYKIKDAKNIAALLDFSLDSIRQTYQSEDPEKLSQRVINQVQVVTKKEIQKLTLQSTLTSIDETVEKINESMVKSKEMNALGIEILSFSLLAIRPTPETSRALEAETREELLKKADEALHTRRNAAIEQERIIKENELNTEIAVENKKREIQETKMEAKKVIQEKEYELKELAISSKITLEESNSNLVELKVKNAKKESDAKAYAVEALMKSVSTVDPKTLQAITSSNMSSEQLIAHAFQDIADNSEKIGQLNITPDLLKELMNRDH